MSTTTGNGGNRQKICLILLALASLLFQSRIYSAGSLEKKIKKLELEVIEFERKTAGVRAKQKKPAKEGVADKKTKAPKEMHMAIPEYDPATRNIAVKNKEEAEKDTAGAIAAEKASEAETPAKILLSDAAGKVEEAEQVQLTGSGRQARRLRIRRDPRRYRGTSEHQEHRRKRNDRPHGKSDAAGRRQRKGNPRQGGDP